MRIEHTQHYLTQGGIAVYRASMAADYQQARLDLIGSLDNNPGVFLSSSYEAPGRYTRWDIGAVRPPLRFIARGRDCELQALNARGEILLRMIKALLAGDGDLRDLRHTADRLCFGINEPEPVLTEEQRTRQRGVFSVLRRLIAHFASFDDNYLGFYGAFAYDLAFQLEAVEPKLTRDSKQRDLVLYLPDTILVVDHKREVAQCHYYDFEQTIENTKLSTRYLPRQVAAEPFVPAAAPSETIDCDHAPGEYAAVVERALAYFHRGDLFEVVPGQTFSMACPEQPSQLFYRLQTQNPAPYGALMNLGEGEFLVAASPEMYVRVTGRRVESCPISGTIARGRDALEDAEQIRALLNSAKDAAELAMCTDVDRNDKARVCEPGSIRILERRQVELYSRLIHTVDHVEGVLRTEFDGLDAFLSHAWAVTLTGAPKHAALQFIEDHEKSPRRWYGGALGALLFNGDVNTGISIRAMRLHEGRAEVRAGATLLADSEPQAEEAETRLKASALLAVLRRGAVLPVPERQVLNNVGQGRRILMVDHQDSFVHMLASYLRESGAEVCTVRPPGVLAQLQGKTPPQLVVLSPGPGRPAEQGVSETLRLCERFGIPVFGVCLGLQGMVEYFGGTLRTLPAPMHGKSSLLSYYHGALFEGCKGELRVGRYHSLAADRVPDCLDVLARGDDGVVMALRHRTLPMLAVQFHPESLLSLDGDLGRRLLANALRILLPVV
ncbi:MAG: anthranilate synthase component I [Pseudomonadales bacterium]|jgi:anthranilate synthase|nr:anthranilate synthase component I [Pseudomonadales bacterium]